MKSNNPFIKNFGYITIILAFLISVHLLLTILSEEKIITIKQGETNFFSNIKTAENSENDFEILSISKIYYSIDLIFRCGLAFFLGALISEKRFIFLGKI